MTDRFGIIGASEVAGLLKEYSANLLAENIISEGINDQLLQMPNYLETRYSLAKKLMLDKEQFEKFQANYDGEKKLIKTKDATKTAKTLNRGKTLEEVVKDDFFCEYEWSFIQCDDDNPPKRDRAEYVKLFIVQSQTQKEKLIKGCKFPFRATIDYLLSDNSILECKTTEINDTTISIERWKSIKEGAIPFNYYIQCQSQLWLHEKETCNIHIAGVNKEHQILDSKSFTIGLDTKIIRAITASLIWFSAEFERGSLLDKKDEDKAKKDKQIDEFLELERGTLEKPLDSDLSAKLSRLKELEEQKKEYEKLDKEIRETIRQSMTGYKYARFKSNQFQIEAKYSNESYHDEASINEAIEKAKSIQIGDVKASKKLTIKY